MSEKKWFALYTRSRAEKKVLVELEYAGIEAYLPLITRMRKWSDRLKKVEEPLFRSYIFVCIHENEYFTALNIPGAMRFVSFESKAVEIPEKQIEAIRFYLNDPESLDADEKPIAAGQLVRVKHGQMEGLIGRLMRYKNKHRLLVIIEAIGQTIMLNIPRTRVEVVNEAKKETNGESSGKRR
jgi:transcription antitermination factor NusG